MPCPGSDPRGAPLSKSERWQQESQTANVPTRELAVASGEANTAPELGPARQVGADDLLNSWSSCLVASGPRSPTLPPVWLDSDAVMRAPHRGGRLRPRLEARRRPRPGQRQQAARDDHGVRGALGRAAGRAGPARARPHAEDARRRLARPSLKHLCYTCPRARVIVACQRIGWLVPRTPKPKPAKPPSRASLKQRLRKAEAQADKLRRQLAQLDAPAKQQRDD